MAGMHKKATSKRLDLMGTTRLSETELEYSWCVENASFASRSEFEIVSPTFCSHDDSEWQLMLFTEYVDYQHYVSGSLVKVSDHCSTHIVKYNFKLGDVYGQIFDSKSDEGIFRKKWDRKSCPLICSTFFGDIVKRFSTDTLLVQCNMKIIAAENPEEVLKSKGAIEIKRLDSRLEEREDYLTIEKKWNNLSTQSSAADEFKETNTLNISPHNFKNSHDVKGNDTLSNSDQDNLVKLSKSFEFLYERKTMCDVTLRTDDADVSAHRLILSARSTYFASLLEGKECIELEGFCGETIDEVLFYIYTGKTRHMSPQLVLEVLRSAVLFQMISLSKSCVEIVKSNLCPDNVIDVLKLTSEVEVLDDLKTSAMKCIGSNPSAVMKTETWNMVLQENPRIAGEVLLYVDSVRKNEKKLAHSNIDKNIPIKYSKIA